MAEKIKIIIATHKKYEMPKDNIYIPLHVGAEGKQSIGYQGDNTGDNISCKNPSFCELTGLYWAWKNIDSEYIGLAHYRRHFTIKKKSYRKKHQPIESVLAENEALKLISKYDIILPKKQNYIIETLYSHYSHTHYPEHLDVTREIIKEIYPDYLEDFDYVMKQRKAHMFNMFIMKKEYVDDYCKWLFNILFELEKKMGIQKMSEFQGRFYGRVSELIFNCWLIHLMKDKDINVCSIPYYYMEKVNWNKKIKSFLKAKFFNQKYEGSF